MSKKDAPLSNDLVSDSDSDGRSSHSAGAGRSSSHEDQRRPITEARGLSKAEFISKFRDEMYNNVLPAPPQVIDGYHLCWGSTTNQSDTIARRQSLGYELVRTEEMPGLDHIAVTTGSHQGCIGCNEMLLMKLPLELYWAYMHIAHHERPMEHQNKMKQTLQGLKAKAEEDGVPIALADGSQSFVRASAEPRPMFTE
jgi:hypothetical protein